MELKDRVAIVTGGGAGIGAALCRRFAVEGAHVIVADIDGDAARSIAADVDGRSQQLDVADRAAVGDLVGDIERDLGRIDLFCSNAGIGGAGGVEATDEVWRRTWEVNVMAHVYAADAALPGMLRRGGGYLLATASAAGLLSNLGAAPYSVTKHGAVALAEWLAITYGDRGIKVSCLCPQFVDTALVDEFATTPELRSWIREVSISPEAVAEAVVAGLRAERFLILPHPEVGPYFRAKAADYDDWLARMRALQARVLPHPPEPGTVSRRRSE